MSKVFLTFLLIIFTNPLLISQTSNFALSLKLSTLGFGLEGITQVGENINVRAGGNYFTYNMNGGGGSHDFKYVADARLLTFSSQVDWFPFENNLRFSGALFYNLNRGDIELEPTRSHTISGRVYTPEEIGIMNGSIFFPKVAPYLGVGYGNPMKGSPVSFSFDFGLLYQSSPNIELTAAGLVAPSATQAPLIEDNLSWFKIYPVLSFAINYKF
jgi:hypothetical protein